MAQILVRNVDEPLKKRLQRRAKRHGRSMEAEVREILRDVLKQERSIEDRRNSDVKAKLTRLLSDCDLLIIPRYTIINTTIGSGIPPRLHRLTTTSSCPPYVQRLARGACQRSWSAMSSRPPGRAGTESRR